jgi:hypothetical protein
LLTAPTGVAAFNIGGVTLHSALLLGCNKFQGYKPLTADKLNTLRSRLMSLQLLIIDEVSMVGSNMLLEIHKRLQEIKGASADQTFGGVSILAVGDLFQLPPVCQPHLFGLVSDAYARLHKTGSLWKDEFVLFELDEIMRQRDDATFAELLCRVRVAACTENDITLLKSRVVHDGDETYPQDALHVYKKNVDVAEHNMTMLNKLVPKTDHILIRADDDTKGQTRQISVSHIPNNATATGGLPTTLILAKGAKVMLTVNVDVCDGLVNGARGIVTEVIKNAHKILAVLVKFDTTAIGLAAIQGSPYKTRYPNSVPILRHTVSFTIKGIRGAEITRNQFPLVLAWATTIHKVQGLTLNQIVVNLKGGKFSPGQTYVALSRVKTLNKLFLFNFHPSSITKSVKVEEEMTRLRSNHAMCSFESPLLGTKPNLFLSYLNIRSYNAKLADLQIDPILQASDILCFSETWLSPHQQAQFLKVDHSTFRCDRNAQNTKGGVFNFSVKNTETFST